jgi:feruloyl esterase
MSHVTHRMLGTAIRCLVACAVTVLVDARPADAQTPCAALARESFPSATITVADVVPGGGFQPPGGRAGGRGAGAFAALRPFCRLAATLAPTAQSTINVEVWLPASAWNGRLQVVGNGAFAGTISYPAMATALAAGYATASTDTGHTGPAANTFVNQDVLVDFAHRAIHETTAFAKLVVARVYGKPQEFAYFNGCSTGGRQALTAAQRYPTDFDGIVAGAPATLTSSQVFSQVLVHQALSAPDAALPREALDLLHSRVLAACDAADGAADGVLEQPLACRFDPQVLACREASSPGSCLTRAQVEAARRVYTGAVNPRTGASIFPGLERGSELGWSPAPISYAVDWLKYVFKDPAWDPKTLNFDADVAKVTARDFQLLDANDPNLNAFAARGGKLLMYQGWAEPGIPPRNIVRYYGEVQKQTSNASQAVRLFMVPGMGHCGGGDGASTFDMVAALDAWKTRGTAPESIPASRVRNGAVDRTRPLCAYPGFARYQGAGSMDDAASFACVSR